MKTLVDVTKKVMGIHPQQGVKPLANLVHVGSEFHGYFVPENFLTSESVCYCVGAGEDISFDTELKARFDARVYIFDPTPEGINHFQKLKEYTQAGKTLTIHNEPPNDSYPFTYRLSTEQIDAVTYVNIGVWDQKTVLRFFEPQKENYVSHSVYLFKDSEKYIEAPVDRLSNLMKMLNHTTVDLVKLEIEGAEYTVIDTIVEDKPDVKMILVEFDEVHNVTDKGYHFRIKNACAKLRKAGYVLVHSTESLKRTFVREDVHTSLIKTETAPS
ncbi:FkbM family methyltransferase [Spirosoma oryzicola]|uniref:FkbM family methyltransferase n=1 Tax=Spirosoma oryzicola TaxID=2898794 RepID=UPI001E5A1B7F|nr:FkbM family methyltransferase [Spirosoma oryzicola]UHG92969.1 FkbM family methyltransferase [Spirosoma oryzicola]